MKPKRESAPRAERISMTDARRIGDARLEILQCEKATQLAQARATIIAAELLKKYRIGPADRVEQDGTITRANGKGRG
jgi:hypothetical protein